MPAESPKIIIAEEPVAQVLPDLVALLSRNRAQAVTPERFDWLYLRNPDGPAVVWSIRDDRSGEIVGFTACLPRRMLVDGEQRVGWNCADFSVDRQFRTLGPAAKLRRQARVGIDSGRADFLYAHPNQRMESVHRLVGNTCVGTMLRFARPLKIGDYIGDRLNSSGLGKVAGRVLDPLYRMVSREFWLGKRQRIRFVPQIQFDQRFDELFARRSTTCRIVGIRDATYLNWRYAQSPLWPTHALLYETDERLEGYLLFSEEKGFCDIKDLFPPDDPDVTLALLQAVVREGWSRGMKGLSMIALEHGPLIQLLGRCGFKRRQDRLQMFIYSASHASWGESLLDPRHWHMTAGDRDV